jgi:hypothetical protein
VNGVQTFSGAVFQSEATHAFCVDGSGSVTVPPPGSNVQAITSPVSAPAVARSDAAQPTPTPTLGPKPVKVAFPTEPPIASPQAPELLLTEEFEGGSFGNFQVGGGKEAKARTDRPAVGGLGSVEIKMKESTPPFLSVNVAPFNLQRFKNLEFTFFYNAGVVKSNDGIKLEYSTDAGLTWNMVKSWIFAKGADTTTIDYFTNTGAYNYGTGVVALNSSMTNNILLRLILTGQKDLKFYLDSVKIYGLY